MIYTAPNLEPFQTLYQVKVGGGGWPIGDGGEGAEGGGGGKQG